MNERPSTSTAPTFSSSAGTQTGKAAPEARQAAAPGTTPAAPGAAPSARGTLRVYLGAAPGVGKTFAMLNEGRRRRERGEDVVAGFVEAHGRARTAQQVGDLEVVPRRELSYRGAQFEEMDLAAILARHPDVALVDELAHTNVPGSVNEKRWQDIEDLLGAGISVISTVNIQHLVSLNDVVERITGVVQRETVPDEVVRRADQLELVDHPPETIRARLARGDIYPPERIDTALGNYFRAGNLAALRELALLWIADRVEEGLDEYRKRHGISDPWETRERVLVGLDGTAQGDRLIRRAARMAQRVNGELVAVHVTPQDGLIADRGSLDRERRLVEQLGGTYREVAGVDLGRTLAETAQVVNATQLVIGATRRSRLWLLLHGSVVSGILRAAGPGLDVHVISRKEAGEGRQPPAQRRLPTLSRRRVALGFAIAVAGLPLLTWILDNLRAQIGLQGVLMAFLLLVVAASAVGGIWPALFTAVGGFLLVNWFFTPPLYTFTIGDPSNIAALLFFLTVAVVVSLFVSIATRRAAEGARLRTEASALALLAGSPTVEELLASLHRSFDYRNVSLQYLEGSTWRTEQAKGDPSEAGGRVNITVPIDAHHLLVAQGGHEPRPEDRRLLDAYAKELAAAIAREHLEHAASQADALESADQLRTAILSAVSHDLRTPLAGIKASATSLLQEDVSWSPEARRELLQTIDEEVDRLNSLIGNLLDMSRLQTGSVSVRLRPTPLEEVLPAALDSLGARGRDVQLQLPEGLPDVVADHGLLERALANIIGNAVSFSPDGRPARVVAGTVPSGVDVRIIDRGPGVSGDERERMFVPFQRLGDSSRREGVGLGLAVARGFVIAMGGSIELEDTPGGGLTVIVSLEVAE
jgi:two-component system, OmpR family, sensor histidine kinase KdpD